MHGIYLYFLMGCILWWNVFCFEHNVGDVIFRYWIENYSVLQPYFFDNRKAFQLKKTYNCLNNTAG